VWLLLAGGRYMRLLLLLPIALNLLLIAPLTGPRLNTIINQDTSATVDVSIAQRKVAAEISVELFKQHPVLGVGVGNFPIVAPDLAPDLSTGKTTLSASHDLYLQRLSEGGVVGLLGWLVFVGTVLFVLTRALMFFALSRSGRRSIEEWLTIGAFSGIVGWSAASAFLHLAVFRSLLVLFALAAALDIYARSLREREPEPEAEELSAGSLPTS
jgi:O-antigen ligase